LATRSEGVHATVHTKTETWYCNAAARGDAAVRQKSTIQSEQGQTLTVLACQTDRNGRSTSTKAQHLPTASGKAAALVAHKRHVEIVGTSSPIYGVTSFADLAIETLMEFIRMHREISNGPVSEIGKPSSLRSTPDGYAQRTYSNPAKEKRDSILSWTWRHVLPPAQPNRGGADGRHAQRHAAGSASSLWPMSEPALPTSRSDPTLH
jgi:hypothetical protein